MNTCVVIPIVAAAIGALVGWALGRVTKQIEFRYELLARLAENYERTETAVMDLIAALRRQKEVGVMDRQVREEAGGEVERSDREVRSALREALSRVYLVEAAFEDAADEWRAMVAHFSDSRRMGIDHEAIERSRDLAVMQWHRFAKTAVEKCGFMPWAAWRARTKDMLTAGKWRDESCGEKGGQA